MSILEINYNYKLMVALHQIAVAKKIAVEQCPMMRKNAED